MPQKRILIIHTHGIGDWILFSPVLKNLKEKYPDHKIDIITALQPTTNYIQEHKKINIIKTFNFRNGSLEYIKFLFYLLTLKYESVLLTAGFTYWKIQLIGMFLLRNKNVFGLLRNGRKNLFIKNPVYYELNWHKSRINYELCNALNNTPAFSPEYTLQPTIPFENTVDNSTLDVIIHPGCDSANKYRRWPVDNFIYVIDQLLNKGYSVGVIIGPSELDLVDAFDKCKQNPNFNIYITLPFEQLFRAISRYKIVLTNDSSIGHIGGGLNKYVMSIFGPASPLDTGPLGDNVKIIYPEIKLDCMPCVKEGGKFGCEEQTCLKSIQKEMILNHIVENLN